MTQPAALSTHPWFNLAQRIGLLALVLVTAGLFDWGLPRLFDEYWQQVILEMLVYVIAAVSLNLVLGQCGQFSIGHAAFMAIGGYAAALLVLKGLPALLADPAWAARLGVDPDYPLVRNVVSWVVQPDGRRVRTYTAEFTWLGYAWPVLPVLLGGLLAAVAGWLVGMPCLRLRGDYLAIVTLGLGEIVRVSLENSTWVGGANGLAGVPRVMSPGWVLALTIVCVYILANLVRSTLGKAFLTLREDEVAAEAVGVNTTSYKVQAFTIGAFFAGVAGAMLVHVQGGVVPKNASWVGSFELIAMVVLGGAGSVTGAVLAALVLRFLPEGLRALNDVGLHRPGEPALDGWSVERSTLIAAIVGLAVVGLLLVVAGRALQRRGVHGWRTGVLRGGAALALFAAGLCGLFWLARANGINLEEFRVVIYAAMLVGIMLLRPQGLFGRAEITDLFRRERLPRPTPRPEGEPLQEPPPPVPATGPLLACRDLVIRFGGLTAVDNFNLRLERGEIVGLIGPNGAGKTTVFNLLTGVYAPTQGTIEFAGRRVDRLRPFRRNALGIARTFQNIRLFANLSVLDNVRIARHVHLREGLVSCVLRLPGFYREEQQTLGEAMDLLALLGLDAVAHEPAGSLPYGDQRRLEIARALATRPQVLLLDEPAAGMNPQEKVELRRLVQDLRRRFALTILLIEHDVKLVMGVCERIVVLDHGATIAAGPPEQIQKDPRVIEAYLGEPVKTA